MAHFKLYDYALSGNGWKVRTVLRRLGHAFTIQWVDLIQGEQHEAWFRAKNPVGQIPVLVDDAGLIWTESNAILESVADGTSLLPSGHERHQVRAWLCFEQTWVDGVISRARFRRKFPEVVHTPPEFFDVWRDEGTRALATLESHLSSRTFMVAERFTIADIGLYAYVHVAEEGGFALSNYPSLATWLRRVSRESGIRGLLDNPEAVHRAGRERGA